MAVVLSSTVLAAEPDGRIEAKLGEHGLLAWQAKPLANPTGGAKFAGSALFESAAHSGRI
jgi:hypothetical protein